MNSVGSLEKTRGFRAVSGVSKMLTAPKPACTSGSLCSKYGVGGREQMTKGLKGPWHFLQPIPLELRHHLGHKRLPSDTWKIYHWLSTYGVL